jgi:hypothetical protein
MSRGKPFDVLGEQYRKNGDIRQRNTRHMSTYSQPLPPDMIPEQLPRESTSSYIERLNKRVNRLRRNIAGVEKLKAKHLPEMHRVYEKQIERDNDAINALLAHIARVQSWEGA